MNKSLVPHVIALAERYLKDPPAGVDYRDRVKSILKELRAIEAGKRHRFSEATLRRLLDSDMSDAHPFWRELQICALGSNKLVP